MRDLSAGHAVVIAGGGPTGMMLAGELALAGVDVAIVERRATQELEGSRRSGDTSTKSRVGLGLLVGGLGAVIGAGIGSAMPGHYRPRRVGWPDDETASDRRSGNTSRSKQMSTARTPERAVDPKTATNRVPEGTGTGLPASDE